MKKKTTLLTLGILISSQMLPMVAHANSITTSNQEEAPPTSSVIKNNESDIKEVILDSFNETDVESYAIDDTSESFVNYNIIEPLVVTNNFDLNVDGTEVIPGVWYDLPTNIRGRYMADNVSYFVDYYQLELINTSTSEVTTMIDESSSFNFDIQNMPDAKYSAKISGFGTFLTYGISIPQTWTISFAIELKSTDATVSIDRNYNPNNASLTHRGDSSLWTLEDEVGNILHTGSGDRFDGNLLQQLEEGTYLLRNISRATTDQGTVVPESEDVVQFVIRHPQSSIVIDSSTNPNSITGTKKISESELTWNIRNSDGDIIESGVGSIVPPAIIQSLEDGEYSAEFTETSPEAETSTSSGSFEIISKEVPPKDGADVTINYKNTDGEEILSPLVLSGIIGEAYSTSPEEINGYTFKEVIGSKSGTFTESEQTITYVYTKNSSDVTVNYKNTDGEEILSPLILSGSIGEAYSTGPEEINGYTFKEVIGSKSGTFTESEQIVTYVYTKNESKSETNKESSNDKNDGTSNSTKTSNLPSTGEQSSVITMTLGGLMLILAGGMALFGLKKIKK